MILEFVQGWITSHPTVATVLSCIGLLRLLLKPAFSVAEAIAAKTPSKRDDQIIADIKNSKAMNAVRYCLDWFASIKLPNKRP